MKGNGAWQSGYADVRTLISDGATDKLRYRKEVFGNIDGSNVTFKTFETRRVTNFTTSSAPLGVYGNGVGLTVSADDVESGEFTLSAAPAAGTVLRATYYQQWYDDSELEQFLTTASEWISGQDDWTTTPLQLIPAAKQYAAASAYQKLAVRMSQNLAEQFQLYDAPDQKRFDPVMQYQKMAESLFKLAFELRDDTYKNRQGQGLAPIWGTVRGRTKDVPPNR